MKYALSHGWTIRDAWDDVVVAADELGYDVLFMPDHLVLPAKIRGELVPGEEHPPLASDTPMFDPLVYLGWLAARTNRIQLGTLVYLMALRHPFAVARAFATIDQLSGGRAICGVGAGWLTSEWEAAELDPSTRGERLDEAIEVCRRLWTDDYIEHHGKFFSFDAVCMEPKPKRIPLPVHIGGESPPALRRAAAIGDGWLGMFHNVTSRARAETLHRALEANGRDPEAFEVTVAIGPVDDTTDIDVWNTTGVTQLVVAPWTVPSDPIAGLERFAKRFIA